MVITGQIGRAKLLVLRKSCPLHCPSGTLVGSLDHSPPSDDDYPPTLQVYPGVESAHARTSSHITVMTRLYCCMLWALRLIEL